MSSMSTSGFREIAFDCKFFRGDRPCTWHKKTGVLCTCEHYAKVEEQVLIVKLDAMGDVLRSTALLPPLAEVHPHAAITWLTRRESVPLLQGNPFVSEVLEVGAEANIHLQTRRFDRVINLDASRISAALATAASAPRKDGFVLDERGTVRPTNDAARRWLEAGLFDDIKRRGTATYQDRMAEILELLGSSSFMIVPSEADFQSPLAPHIEQYLATDTAGARDRVKLFRLAWDIAGSAFGSRQVLYERFFASDPLTRARALNSMYPRDAAMDRVRKFLDDDAS